MARRTLVGIGLFCGLLGAVAGWVTQGVPAVQIPAVGLTLALCGFFLWMARAQANSRVIVDDTGVEFVAPLYGRRIPATAIVKGSLRATSIGGGAGDALRWRTNGLGVPGYNLGWFRTFGGKNALVAAAREDVVTFETRDGYGLCVAVDDPTGLEGALRKVVAGAT